MEEENDKSAITITGMHIGLCSASCFLSMIALVPWNVPEETNVVLSARLYPYAILVAGLVLSTVFSLAFRMQKYKIDLTVWPLAVGGLLYYFGLLYAGFIVATALVMLYFARCWGIKNVKTAAVLAIITPAVFHLIFKVLLKVGLPEGLIFN